MQKLNVKKLICFVTVILLYSNVAKSEGEPTDITETLINSYVSKYTKDNSDIIIKSGTLGGDTSVPDLQRNLNTVIEVSSKCSASAGGEGCKVDFSNENGVAPFIVGGRSYEGTSYNDTLTVQAEKMYSGSATKLNVRVEQGSTFNLKGLNLVTPVGRIENKGTVNFENVKFDHENYLEVVGVASENDPVINSNINFSGTTTFVQGYIDISGTPKDKINVNLNGGIFDIRDSQLYIGRKDNTTLNVLGSTIRINLYERDPGSGEYSYGRISLSNIPVIKGGTLELVVDDTIVLEDEETIEDLHLMDVEQTNVDYSFIKDLNLTSNLYSLMFNYEKNYFYLINSKKHSKAMENINGSSEQIKQAQALDNVDRSALNSEGQVMMNELDDLARKANQNPALYANDYKKAVSALFDTDGSKDTIAPQDQAQMDITNSIGDIVEGRVSDVLEISEEPEIPYLSKQYSMNDTIVRYGRNAGEIRSKNGISALWVQGMHTHSKYSKGSAFHMDADGATMGADFLLGNNFTAGGSYSYTFSEVNMIGMDSISKTNSNTFSAYLGYRAGKFMYRLNSSYMLSRVKSDTEVTKNSRKIYKKDSHNNTIMASVTYKPNAFSYTAGLRYIKLHNATYETNTKMRVEGYNSHTTIASASVGYSKFIKLDNSVSLIPNANVGFGYELNRDNNVLLIHLPANVTMSQKVKNNKRDFYSLGAGLTANVKDVGMFTLGYSGAFKANLKSHTITLNYKYSF
ncbi:MAG: autotransporter outer membrane beta-barrel domain-containing protein [Alphaproteobacteria bacterium]|nr:autotransporter outer membrane beta-barrel domain-containing protein [Alphaproteobacteria bacterium]